MSRRLILAVVMLCSILGKSGNTADYYVSPDGSDEYPGTESQPFQTISKAAESAYAGDTIHVLAGEYAESVRFTHPGTAESPIRCIGYGSVLIAADGYNWGVWIDGYLDNQATHIEISNFEIINASRGGIRVSWAPFTRVMNCRNHHNGKWGIFTDYSDDLLIQGNVCFENQDEHGIYVSNSSDRPVIRGNLCYNNGACGIQINADPQMEGDGITSDALIEENTCVSNGAFGGAAINLASVRDSVIRNNLLVNNLAGGIAAWGDGNGPEWGCKNNRFFNNLIFFEAGQGRWCISLKEGSTDNMTYNNILIGGRRGSLEFSTDSSFTSDFNVMFAVDQNAVVTVEDGAAYSFADWQSTGMDMHSVFQEPGETFMEIATGNFHHKPLSKAIDHGFEGDAFIPENDIDHQYRYDDPDMPNLGTGSGFYDIGCYEYHGGSIDPTPTPPAKNDVQLTLEMGATQFYPEDMCFLDLLAENLTGSEITFDVYLLLDVFGSYYWFPSWQSTSMDFMALSLSPSESRTMNIIPEFIVPPGVASEIYAFYSAGFESGSISADAIISNVAVYSFSFE
ncbi:right-handed parallel beta-helix repeat-containing protein [bacterium]|nr:right-handed parallel beta-helix repeat-containing protein [candidate division CSSED10-310 bacterium]